MERPESKELTLEEKLFEDRILFLGPVTTAAAVALNMKLLYLEAQDPDRDIFLFIDSPGGSVHDGLSIFDTMNFVSCDVWTLCMGMAASMGAFLLAGGTKGKRIALPNSTVMIHQPLQGFGPGHLQATEIQIAAKEIMRTRERLNRILAKATGQPFERVDGDTERDFWMTAEEALGYGLVDQIASDRRQITEIARRGGNQGEER
jgi:ATP-dependent Clp protease, protease subunit